MPAVGAGAHPGRGPGVRGRVLAAGVLKAVSGGYDGKGVWVCESAAEAKAVLATAGLAHGALLAGVGGLIAEEYVAFDRELAVLAARSPHRQGAVYPVVQTVQRDGICREVIAPAPGLTPGRRTRGPRRWP